MKRLLALLLFIALAASATLTTEADGAELPQAELMRVTCYYCNSGVTASGNAPIANYTCGARRDLIGSIALVYEDNNGEPGDFIGLYEIQDTGSADRIQTGKSIDIYQTTYADCKAYVKAHGDYQWVYIVKGNG